MAFKSARELKQLGKQKGYGPKQHSVAMDVSQGSETGNKVAEEVAFSSEQRKCAAAEAKRKRKLNKNKLLAKASSSDKLWYSNNPTDKR